MPRTNSCISNVNRRTDGRTDGRTEWGIAIALSQIGWLGANETCQGDLSIAHISEGKIQTALNLIKRSFLCSYLCCFFIALPFIPVQHRALHKIPSSFLQIQLFKQGNYHFNIVPQLQELSRGSYKMYIKVNNLELYELTVYRVQTRLHFSNMSSENKTYIAKFYLFQSLVHICHSFHEI